MILSIKKNKIFRNGKKINLKGVSLGGWLMMEGYMLGGKNIPESIFKRKLKNEVGERLAGEFTLEFRKRFISKTDFRNIKKLGFNCVRLPFNYRLIEKSPYKIDKRGLDFLVQQIKNLSKEKIYVILDMHAVPGAQNQDWHSDSSGVAGFWEKRSFRDRFFFLWKELSNIFKDNEFVAGYDIMNEPVTKKWRMLKNVYKQTIDIIRKNGDKHIIFLEGNNWAQDADFLEDLFIENEGNNIALSVHFYEPTAFTFNLRTDVVYPGKVSGKKWDKNEIVRRLKKYSRFLVPVYVGEFGVSSRCSYCGHEYQWVKDVLSILKDLNYHWTYWTYKSVGGMNFPDGLYQFFEPYDIFGRDGNNPGMEKIAENLVTKKRNFYQLLSTENFCLNRSLYGILKGFL